MLEALRLARLFLFSPSKAAKESRREEALYPCLGLYVAMAAGYLLFYWLKPYDFPDRYAALPRELQSELGEHQAIHFVSQLLDVDGGLRRGF